MFSLLGLVILLATSHELWLEYYERPIQPQKVGLVLKSLHCFSMLSNGRKLLSTKSGAVDNLACLNGIRVLSTNMDRSLPHVLLSNHKRNVQSLDLPRGE